VASLQEELAAVKLREAEANLALKDLKAKVLLKIKQIFKQIVSGNFSI